MKVLTVVGTRPEAIKLAPLALALDADSRFTSILCSTGQHKQLLAQTLAQFSVTPDMDLGVMTEGQDLFDVTSRVLLGMRQVLREHRPDIVIVQGDTTTSFAGGLAAFYEGIPVGHVEAGLRSHDLAHPFPEEANRRLTSVVTKLHFAPTEGARANLLCEGTDPSSVHVTGNTVIDALLWMADRLADAPTDFAPYGPAADIVAGDAPVVLVTGHRRENFGPGFIEICNGIRRIAEKNPHAHIIYPVHPNPNVRKPVDDRLSGIANIHLIPPLDYAPFVRLMERATILLTDSGGIQEEGPSLGKPVLVMRNTTERPEAVEAGTAILVGADADNIFNTTHELLHDADKYRSMADRINPYGDGKSCQRILSIIHDNRHTLMAR